MAAGENRRHIRFEGFSKAEGYTSPIVPRTEFAVARQNRVRHGNAIKKALLDLKSQFDDLRETNLTSAVIHEDAIYVEFISEINFQLAFDSLDNARGLFVLLSTKKIITELNGQSAEQYKAIVMLRKGGVSAFLKKVEAYLSRGSKKRNHPLNQKLINNIKEIKLATIESFWFDHIDAPFPGPNDSVWWEVWLRRSDFEKDVAEDAKVLVQLENAGVVVNGRRLLFPEHIVRLVKGTATQLSESLLLLDNLSELRSPQEISDFFSAMTLHDERDWVSELQRRIDKQMPEIPVAICLLDTGVNNGHPLLKDFLLDANMDSMNPDWGNSDGSTLGHGTQMAGLALYGDLTSVLASRDRITIFHELESVKLINKNTPHDPDLYGKVTEEAVARPIVKNPNKIRIFCMAVTSQDGVFHGRPSSWSAAVDNIIFEESTKSKNVFVVSSGNVLLANPEDYPNQNDLHSIEDPGQAFNVLTVGAYADKDLIDTAQYPGARPLATIGQMCPSNPTSLVWERDWPIKPDIVFEGGNMAYGDDGFYDNVESLLSLTTNNDFNTKLFSLFGDTSGATALAARFSAQISAYYPQLWAETYRGLLVHSAEWLRPMTGNRRLNDLTREEKITILKRFGYGVPNLTKALHSVDNSLTLVAERTIQPYQKIKGDPKTKDLHIYELPWPKDVLQQLAETQAQLTITLSYFIEPNPGDKKYSSKYRYQSHGLRFKMNGPLETREAFRHRVNKAAETEDEDDQGQLLMAGKENWLLGSIRNRGSVHKDIWTGTAADLSTKNLIAVYPVSGWYRLRHKLKKFDSSVRYSLLISIETPGVDVDLYTPILNQIGVPVALRPRNR